MSFVSSDENHCDSAIPQNVDRFPKKIMLTGFPIHLIGWNGIYERNSDGEYELPSHELVLFGFLSIDILGVVIYHDKTKSKWMFKRNCDREAMYQNCELMGNWHRFTVNAVSPNSAFWISQMCSFWFAFRHLILESLIAIATLWCYCVFLHHHFIAFLSLFHAKSVLVGFGLGFCGRTIMQSE
jgi:hypothetical protein